MEWRQPQLAWVFPPQLAWVFPPQLAWVLPPQLAWVLLPHLASPRNLLTEREAWKLDSMGILSPVRLTPTTTPVLYEISRNSWRFLSCCPRMTNMPLQLTCKINDGSICAKNSVTKATVTSVSRTSLWLVWYSQSSS